MAIADKSLRMKANDFNKLVSSGASRDDIIRAIPNVTCGVKTFYSRWPSFFQYFSQTRGAPAQWVDFVVKWPVQRGHADFTRLKPLDWFNLLRQAPRFASYALAYLETVNVIPTELLITLFKRQPRLLHIEQFCDAAIKVGLDPELLWQASTSDDKDVALRLYEVWDLIPHEYTEPHYMNSAVVPVKRAVFDPRTTLRGWVRKVNDPRAPVEVVVKKRRTIHIPH